MAAHLYVTVFFFSDMMLKSGCSTCFYDVATDKMIGACINTVWWVKPNLGKGLSTNYVTKFFSDFQIPSLPS